MNNKPKSLIRTRPGAPTVSVPHESVWLANFISDRTKRAYKNAVTEFTAFHGITNPNQLRIVDQAHVIAWRDALIKANASEKTINSRISAISSLFKHLCEKQAAKRNPTVGVKRPKVDMDRVKTPVITVEQVRKMLDAPDTRRLKGIRDKAILSVLFYTGCRVAEVSSLKVKDFYEDAGYQVLDFTVKGGKRNMLAVNQELTIALRHYLDETRHENDRAAPLILSVIRPWIKKPLDPRQLNNIFHHYAKIVALPKGVTPHSARATFITRALDRNCPIEAVQRSVGHAKIVTTQMYDKRLLKHRESASFAVNY